MTALEQLVDRVRQARALGFLPPEWGPMAEAAALELAGHVDVWQSENEFRMRTGSSVRWCQRNFAVCKAQGLARDGSKGREWHMHARTARGDAARELVAQIRRDIHQGAA